MSASIFSSEFMRIRLTPELAYIIGVWKGRRIKEGIGIKASGELQGIFLKEVLRVMKIPPQKIQLIEEKVFFYHSAYRKFFEETEKNQIDIFKKRNNYFASFIAGWFDSVGGVEKTLIYFAWANFKDQILIERLGFRTRFVGKNLFILDSKEFKNLIFNYSKLTRLKALIRSGNERDHR